MKNPIVSWMKEVRRLREALGGLFGDGSIVPPLPPTWKGPGDVSALQVSLIHHGKQPTSGKDLGWTAAIGSMHGLPGVRSHEVRADSPMEAMRGLVKLLRADVQKKATETKEQLERLVAAATPGTEE